MTFVESIVSLIASVFAILTGLVLVGRYIGKKFDHWAETVVENSDAVKKLTLRVIRLEHRLEIGSESDGTGS